MEVKMTQNDKNLIVALEGRLDAVTARDLEIRIMPEIEKSESLVFDFAKLEYISSAGIRVLMGSYQTMSAKGGSMVIRNVTDQGVKEVFEVTGLNNVLNFE